MKFDHLVALYVLKAFNLPHIGRKPELLQRVLSLVDDKQYESDFILKVKHKVIEVFEQQSLLNVSAMATSISAAKRGKTVSKWVTERRKANHSRYESDDDYSVSEDTDDEVDSPVSVVEETDLNSDVVSESDSESDSRSDDHSVRQTKKIKLSNSSDESTDDSSTVLDKYRSKKRQISKDKESEKKKKKKDKEKKHKKKKKKKDNKCDKNSSERKKQRVDYHFDSDSDSQDSEESITKIKVKNKRTVFLSSDSESEDIDNYRLPAVKDDSSTESHSSADNTDEDDEIVFLAFVPASQSTIVRTNHFTKNDESSGSETESGLENLSSGSDMDLEDSNDTVTKNSTNLSKKLVTNELITTPNEDITRQPTVTQCIDNSLICTETLLRTPVANGLIGSVDHLNNVGQRRISVDKLATPPVPTKNPIVITLSKAVVAPKPPEPSPVLRPPEPSPVLRHPEPLPVIRPPEPLPVLRPPEPLPIPKPPVVLSQSLPEPRPSDVCPPPKPPDVCPTPKFPSPQIPTFCEQIKVIPTPGKMPFKTYVQKQGKVIWIEAPPALPPVLNLRVQRAMQTIKEVSKRLNNTSEEIEAIDQSLKVSLICPISNKRIVTPCRSLKCHHFDCFDINNFLEINYNKKIDDWKCPKCKQNAKLELLVIDSLMEHILRITESIECSIENVIFDNKAHWYPDTKNTEKVVNKSNDNDVINIDNSYEEGNGPELIDLGDDDDEQTPVVSQPKSMPLASELYKTTIPSVSLKKSNLNQSEGTRVTTRWEVVPPIGSTIRPVVQHLLITTNTTQNNGPHFVRTTASSAPVTTLLYNGTIGSVRSITTTTPSTAPTMTTTVRPSVRPTEKSSGLYFKYHNNGSVKSITCLPCQESIDVLNGNMNALQTHLYSEKHKNSASNHSTTAPQNSSNNRPTVNNTARPAAPAAPPVGAVNTVRPTAPTVGSSASNSTHPTDPRTQTYQMSYNYNNQNYNQNPGTNPWLSNYGAPPQGMGGWNRYPSQVQTFQPINQMYSPVPAPAHQNRIAMPPAQVFHQSYPGQFPPNHTYSAHQNQTNNYFYKS